MGLQRYVPGGLRPFTGWVGRGFRRAQHVLRSAQASAHERPIFVLGNQKSGTSAVAALLGHACGLEVSLDMRLETDRPLFHRVVSGQLSFDRYLRRNRWEFSHAIVKEPNPTLLHPQIAEAFPASPIVFVIRDPRDNIRSMLNRLAIPGDLPRLEQRHLGQVNPGWALVLDGRWLGLEGEHYVEQLAARWVHCARVYRENARIMHLCRYEDFLADKLEVLRGLASRLGLPMVNDVRDELDRPFQPAGDRSVSWIDFFGPQNLARIESICAEEMRALGYR